MPNLLFNDICRCFASLLFAICITTVGFAQQTEKPTKEPVYRIGRNTNTDTTMAAAAAETKTEVTAEAKTPAKPASAKTATTVGPLDRAIGIAYNGLEHIRNDIKDYTAIMIKRERINGTLSDPEFMSVKVRNRNKAGNIPFSIYMKFLKPTAFKGREVIWVEGRNNNNLIAHDPNSIITKHIRAKLDPDGFLAMRGNRYPIYDAGIENLVVKLIEKGERDKLLGAADVKFFENTKINGRKCSMIQVQHTERKPEYEFNICRIFIDDEYQIPIRYAGYGWPKAEGGKPSLEEEYTYLKIKLNVGLTDKDFDPDNSAYKFP